jgi:transposase-like protein/transposase Tn5 family protein
MNCFEMDHLAWAQAQFAAADLGDRRRTARLISVAAQVAADPLGSLPHQTETWPDLKAAYRLFDAEEVTFQALATPHWDLTRQSAPGRSLILDDTTELDFGATRQIEGLGPVGSGIGRGFLLHSALMVAPETEAIHGLASQVLFYRQPAPKGETRAQRRHRDRESAVWGQLIEQVGAPPPGAQWVHVMDRGADDFEVFCRAQRLGVDWVGRAKSLHRRVADPTGQERPLLDYLKSLPVAGEFPLKLRARPGIPARKARLQVSYGPVTMLVPRQPAESLKQLRPRPIAQGVVWVREVDPPPGLKEPIDWVLYTSLPVESLDDAMTIVGYYEKRWLIEEWHKALKTGCQATQRQLKTNGRLEALMGLLSVVAVRLLQAKGVARTEPERPAVEVVPARYVAMLQGARRVAPTTVWGVGRFFRELAKLGGFLGRKGDGEPGWITIWRGWEKLHLMLRGAEVAARYDL